MSRLRVGDTVCPIYYKALDNYTDNARKWRFRFIGKPVIVERITGKVVTIGSKGFLATWPVQFLMKIKFKNNQ